MDQKKIEQVIAENNRIVNSPEYVSENITEREIAYSWGQGIQEIRELLNRSFAVGFRNYDYYRANSLRETDASQFYRNRTRLLEQWFSGEAKDQFSEAEKEYVIRQYESLQTPFTMTIWKAGHS